MAYELVRTKSIKATAALTNQFVFVKVDSSGGVVLPSAGDYGIGVTQDKPGAGDPCAVCFPGDITKVLCGGTFVAGQDVGTDATGAAVAATSAAYVLGTALTAGAAGALAVIIYQPRGAKGIV